MKINVLTQCETCVCNEVCKIKDEREFITRGIMDSYAIDTHGSFIIGLSCSHYASWELCARHRNEDQQDENQSSYKRWYCYCGDAQWYPDLKETK